MPRLRLSFTELRRRRLALKVIDPIDWKSRSTVTPFSAFSLAAGAFQGLAQIGLMQGGGNAPGGPVLPGAETQGAGTQPQASGPQARGNSSDFLPIRTVPASNRGGGGATAAPDTAAPAKVKAPADDILTAALAPSSDSSSSNRHRERPPGSRRAGPAAGPRCRRGRLGQWGPVVDGLRGSGPVASIAGFESSRPAPEHPRHVHPSGAASRAPPPARRPDHQA